MRAFSLSLRFAAMSWNVEGQQSASSGDDLWSALVTVAESEMERIEYYMVRLQDSDLQKIRAAATAALVASSRTQAAEADASATTTAEAASGSQDASTTTAASPTPGADAKVAKLSGLPNKASMAVAQNTRRQFAKDTAPATAAAAKAMSAKPVPVKPLPADPVTTGSPPTAAPAKQKTPVKCPLKDPAHRPAPKEPTSAEDAITLLMRPTTSTTTTAPPAAVAKEPTVKAMPAQVAATQQQPDVAATSSETAATGSPHPSGDTGAAPTDYPSRPQKECLRAVS